MPAMLGLMAALAMLLAAGQAFATEYEVTNKSAVVYAEHDGTKLTGDLYLPKGRAKAPLLVAVPGGGWQAGSSRYYWYWGLFLARNGYAVFAIDYRTGKAGAYPAAVYDAKAAVQFMRARAAEFDIDPDRIGLMGASSGGQLAALTALAGDQYTSAYRDDANAAVAADVKAVVVFYGVFDMLAQWTHEQIAHPHDNLVEKFLGASPMQNRRIYFEASPISYATTDHNRVRFLLIHGTDDDVVDPASQSGAFMTALGQAGFFARRIVIPGAGHFWTSDPFESEPRSYNALTVPRLLRFLESSL